MRILWKGLVGAAACAVVVTLPACAGSGPPSATEGPAAAARDVITEAELERMNEVSALGAIRRLRPAWLRPRGQSGFRGEEAVRVYVDGSHYGTAESLSDIPLPSVQEIRYLDARRATLRFGTDHGAGAILVTTKRD